MRFWGLACFAALSACGVEGAVQPGIGDKAAPAASAAAGDAAATSPTAATDPPAAAGAPAPVPAYALRGDAMHLYRAQLSVGGGGPFALLVDTGSTALAVAAATCPNCGGRSPTYTLGPQAKAMPGTVGATYGCGVGFQGEDSTGWSGQRVVDQVALGAADAVSMTFSAITNGAPRGVAIPMFTCMDDGVANSAQGIVGLRGAAGDPQSFIGQWAARPGATDLFALQLCDVDGRLWLGTYDPALAAGPPVYTPFSDAASYAVDLQDVQLGGRSLGAAAPRALVDSGTTRLTLPAAPFAALRTALQADASWMRLFGAAFLSGQRCVAAADGSAAAALDAALPHLTLLLPQEGGGTLSVELPATASYLAAEIKGGAPTGAFCPGVENGTLSGAGQQTIIGDTVLHRHILLFDRAHGRLGLAPVAACTAP